MDRLSVPIPICFGEKSGQNSFKFAAGARNPELAGSADHLDRRRFSSRVSQSGQGLCSMIRTRQARWAIIGLVALACGCNCWTDRPRLLERMRWHRNGVVECSECGISGGTVIDGPVISGPVMEGPILGSPDGVPTTPSTPAPGTNVLPTPMPANPGTIPPAGVQEIPPAKPTPYDPNKLNSNNHSRPNGNEVKAVKTRF